MELADDTIRHDSDLRYSTVLFALGKKVARSLFAFVSGDIRPDMGA